MKRIAIVTGASAGLGIEFARQIDALNDCEQIWLLARRKAQLQQVAASLKNAKGVVLPLDLTAWDAAKKLGEKLNAAKNISVAWLVNNAGYGTFGLFETVDQDRQVAMIDLNCRALTAITGVCLPYLHQGAKVINVGSGAGFIAMPMFAVYAATKAYVFSFSQALAAELKGRGVTVTCVCPGPVATEFQAVAGMPRSLAPKIVQAKPRAVVKKALVDAKKGKPTSMYGATMEVYSRMAGLAPRDLVGKFGSVLTTRR